MPEHASIDGASPNPQLDPKIDGASPNTQAHPEDGTRAVVAEDDDWIEIVTVLKTCAYDPLTRL